MSRLKEKEGTITVAQRDRAIIIGAIPWTGTVSNYRPAERKNKYPNVTILPPLVSCLYLPPVKSNQKTEGNEPSKTVYTFSLPGESEKAKQSIRQKEGEAHF